MKVDKDRERRVEAGVRDLIERMRGRLPEEKVDDALESLGEGGVKYGLVMMLTHAAEAGIALSQDEWNEAERLAILCAVAYGERAWPIVSEVRAVRRAARARGQHVSGRRPTPLDEWVPTPVEERVRALIASLRGRLPEHDVAVAMEALVDGDSGYGLEILVVRAVDHGIVLSAAEWDEIEAVAAASDFELAYQAQPIMEEQPVLPHIRALRAKAMTAS